MREIEYVPKESSSKQENRSKWIFASLLVVIIVLIIAVGILLIYVIRSQSYSYCTSSKCIESVFVIKKSMDENFDPCDNFYKFVCNNFEESNYGHQNPIENYSNFRKITYRLNHMIQKLIQSPVKKKDSYPIRIVKNFYAACTDKEQREKLGLSIMNKYLNQANLPRIPSIFSLPEQHWDNYTFNWIETSVMMKKTFGIDLFFKTVVFNDSIHFLVASDGPKIPSLINEDGINIYRNLNRSLFLSYKFKSTMIHLISELFSSEINVKYFRKIIDKVWFQFANLTQQAQNINEKFKRNDSHLIKNREEIKNMTIEEFQKLTDRRLKKNGLNPLNPDEDWKSYVTMLHKELTGKNKNFTNINVRFYESEFDYILNIPSVLLKTSGVMLEMYAWWKSIDLMVLHTTDEMATTLNNLLYSVSDIDTNCLKLTIDKFNIAISHGLITEEFFLSFPRVIKFIESIRDSFREKIEYNKYFNDETKELIFNKLDSMNLFVGAINWILDEKRIVKEYSGIKIRNNTHLDNLMQIVQMEVLKDYKKLYNDRSKEEFYGSLTEIRPYYNFIDNSMIIPWAILTSPFYNLGLTSLEYGALGTIVGREIVYGFNENQIFEMLWSQESFQVNFKDKIKCLLEQYGNYSETMSINHTIADNEGIGIAFNAMKNYFKTKHSESTLPGFETFSSDQLFFLSQAHVWCFAKESTTSRFNSSFKDFSLDEVTKNELKVNGVIQNLPEFAEAFNCPFGSKMNPERKRCNQND